MNLLTIISTCLLYSKSLWSCDCYLPLLQRGPPSEQQTHTYNHSTLFPLLVCRQSLEEDQQQPESVIAKKTFPADTFQRVLNWRSLMKIKIRNCNVHRMSWFQSNWELSLNILLYVPSGSNLIVLLKKEHIGFKQTIIIFPSSTIFGCQ
jgi:hypothetical protein